MDEITGFKEMMKSLSKANSGWGDFMTSILPSGLDSISDMVQEIRAVQEAEKEVEERMAKVKGKRRGGRRTMRDQLEASKKVTADVVRDRDHWRREAHAATERGMRSVDKAESKAKQATEQLSALKREFEILLLSSTVDSMMLTFIACADGQRTATEGCNFARDLTSALHKRLCKLQAPPAKE